MALRFRTSLLYTGALTIAAVVAACGSTSTSTPKPSHKPTPAASTPVPAAPFTPPGGTVATPNGPSAGTYTVQVSLSGSDPVQGSFTQTVAGTTSAHCPVPKDLAGTVSGQHVELHMPSTSSAIGQAQQLSPGDIQVTVGGDVWEVASASNAPHPTTGTLQRNSDGGGSASFQNLALQGNASQQPQESGSVTWTCA